MLISCWPGTCLGEAGIQQSCTAFVDIRDVPLEEERVLPHETGAVEESSISFAGTTAAAHAPQGCRVIDGQERLPIPGLTDSQVHFIGYRKSEADDRNVEQAIPKCAWPTG
jgi:imidazolonepropionase-like amidohydrolase